MQLEYDGYTLTIINIYMPNTQSEKAELIENLRTYLENEQEKDNILIAGDFNLVTDEQDRSPPHSDNTRLVDCWTAIETKNDLIDGWRLTHENERQFTYKQNNSLGRIDRIYTTRHLLKNCLEWTIESNCGISDHQIVTVKIMKQNAPHIGKGLWKLSEEIIKWPPYVNKIRKLLLEMANKMKLKKDKMINIWTETKKTIKEIGIEETNNRRQQIQKTERKIKSKLGKKVRTFQDTKNDRKEIEKIMKELNENGRVRTKRSQKIAKTKYLKEGQKNTKYFFNLNKNKHDPQVIAGLLNKNGKLITNTTGMCEIASEYHKKLQKPPKREKNDTQKINKFLEIVTSTIENKEAQILEKDTNKLEIAKAINDSKNNTAPRIDGILYEFYKFWSKKYEQYKGNEDNSTVKRVESITQILWKVYNEIENDNLYNDNFVLETMTLLYKKKDRQRIENYRPIMLTNTNYKIYTKSIADKLGKIAHKIIHLNQAGFILGRNIHDHTRLTKSMVHYCEIYEKNGYVLSLDQEKAYDKIAHDYLWCVLEKYELPPKFIQKIQRLYKSAQTIVSVNKVLPQAIKIGRGVRQGYPMSCLLYDIAIEPLAESIRKSSLKGFKIQGLEERVLVSLFADDTLVYINEDDNKKTLEQAIKNFCKASTAKFNDEKSEVLPIGTKEYRNSIIKTRTVNKTDDGKLDQAIRIIEDKDSLRTLGAYIGNNSETSVQWETILKKQSRILKGWSKTSLSLKGKELILKALIQSRALYLAMANEMPKSIAQRMTRQMKSFT